MYSLIRKIIRKKYCCQIYLLFEPEADIITFMLGRSLILECNQKIGETVTICGYVQARRDHGKIGFLDVSDRTGIIQVFCTGEQLGDLRAQDVVSITGKVNKRPEKLVNSNLPTGEIEIETQEIKVLSKAAELPFDMGVKELELQLPTLLDYRSLTLRHPQVKAIFKVQDAILEGFRKICKELECVEIVVPEIAADATEGGAEVFNVDYYGHKAFMTQSPQLYKQMLVPAFERVFTIAHAYRAEPSVTTRHLAVSTQMDCEFGFAEFEEVLDLMEQVGMETLKYAEASSQDILKEFKVDPIAFSQVPRLTLREAQEVIFKEFNRDSRGEKDLAPQDEIDICKWAKEKHGSDFVTITHFPTKKRAFYSKPDPKDPEYSLSFDLLFRGVEILSGAERINDYDQLVEAIKTRGMDPKNFEMYLQAFKYGMPPEGGFSFGLERITMHMLELANIREASLFPRDMERVDVRLSTNKPDKKSKQ
jgi:nondiscriminating aspartyl-tRNA synthetase